MPMQRRRHLQFSDLLDIGRTRLMAQVIALQQTIITLLTGDQVALRNDLHPHYATLLSTSSSVRRKSLAALKEQFQRLSQAAPPHRTLTSSQNQRPNCFVGATDTIFCFVSQHRFYASCCQCGWSHTSKDKSISPPVWKPQIRTKDSRSVELRILLQRFHYKKSTSLDSLVGPSDTRKFRCFICMDKPMFPGVSTMAKHLRQHTYNEICG